MPESVVAESLSDISISELRFISRVLFDKDIRSHADIGDLSAAERLRFDAVVSRYADGVPLAYILGEECFYGLRFFIDDRVLSPRPETELLVEESLAWIKRSQVPRVRVLDLCSGSGVVGISIAKHLPAQTELSLFFSDISSRTFAVLRKNAAHHGIRDYRLIRADALSPFADRAFDLVVSNPPYVEDSYAARDTALRHEPAIALRGGPDGSDICKKILLQARRCLRPGGSLFMEISAKNSLQVSAYAASLFGEGACRVYPDYAGRDRILAIQTSDYG